MSALRVLQISNYYYPNIGGIEKIAQAIARSIAPLPDLRQRVLCFNETAQADGFVCDRHKDADDVIEGVEVTRCGCLGKVASQSLSLSFRRRLGETMRELRPNTIVFHYPNPFESHYLMRYLRQDARFILYWHLDITKQRHLGKLFHGQTMRLLERADAIVATSPDYIEGSPYLSRYRHACHVIPNCIDEGRLRVTDDIRRRAAQIREQNEGKVLCFGVGRHVPYKGFSYLIRASRQLDDRFRVFIGGSGELTERLREEAAGDPKVSFLGRISDSELIAHFLAMDIFCFPSISKNEAFGIALAEAMYFGKPAVTFTIPGSGVNYVNVDGQTGLEVPNRDSAAYAQAMTRLADDQELRQRLGAAAGARVRELMLEETFSARVRELISTVG